MLWSRSSTFLPGAGDNICSLVGAEAGAGKKAVGSEMKIKYKFLSKPKLKINIQSSSKLRKTRNYNYYSLKI